MATKKEKIYDEKIAPLMDQIIAICNEHKIANLCTFCLGRNEEEDNDGQLCCTTVMLEDEYEPSNEIIQAARLVLEGPRIVAFTIKKSQNVLPATLPVEGASDGK